MTETTTENVLCTLTTNANIDCPEVWTEWSDELRNAIFNAPNLTCIEREKAEKNANYKQLIPYCVLRHGNKFFAYLRGGSEEKLHGKYSIGIGGHITDEDLRASPDPWKGFLFGMWREWHEEIEVHPNHKHRVIGVINENKSPAGKHHLGIVFLFDLTDRHVVPRNNETAVNSWEDLDVLASVDVLEGWADIVVEQLASGVIS